MYPLQLFFMHARITPLGVITSACTLPSDTANTDAAKILVKPYILRRKEHLGQGGGGGGVEGR